MIPLLYQYWSEHENLVFQPHREIVGWTGNNFSAEQYLSLYVAWEFEIVETVKSAFFIKNTSAFASKVPF